MRDLLVFAPGVLAVLLAAAALFVAYLAYRAVRAAETPPSPVRRASPQGPPSSIPEWTAAATPERHERSEHSWRHSTPHDAPGWFRELCESLYGSIQELEQEVAQLRAEIRYPDAKEVVSEHTKEPLATDMPPHRPGTRGQLVELRDGIVVPSRSLAAMGSLVLGEGGAPASLYLNESVEIDHLAWDRWSEYFDFGDGNPYQRYRTVEPSRINWDASAEQGYLLMRGKAEAL
jgi:hypothetical protein